MKRVLVFLVITGLWFSAFTPAPIKGQEQASRVPGNQDPRPQVEQDPKPQVKFRRVERAIPNRYIVVFNEDSLGIKDSVSQPGDDRTDQSKDLARQRDEIIGQKIEAKAIELARVHRGIIGHVYKHALRGFSAEMSEAEAMALSQNPEVKYVEEDGLINATQTEQINATWGLDRIDQRALPLNSTYTFNNTGAGVNVYVIDTGIRITHQEFGGRAAVAFDAIDDDNNANTPTNTDRMGRPDGIDCNGHGTHVAGTIGGSTFGVAKDVRLHAVRVLGRNRFTGAIGNGCGIAGLNSEITAGVDWVTGSHIKPAVVNMSLGGPIVENVPVQERTSTLEAAIRGSIAAGVTYVVAAGNSNMDASNQSPARVEQAITVGATDSSDTRASFSNFGSVVDVFAPGVGITSAGIASDTATFDNSGTSMAAPHVAGVAALYLHGNPAALPATVSSAITNNASLGRVIDPGTGSPNRLLYSRGVGEIYSTDGQGNLSLLRSFAGLRDSWNLIIPGNFGRSPSIPGPPNVGDGWTDLLFYDRAAGEGEFYTTDGQGNLTFQRAHSGLRSPSQNSWDMIIPGNFGGNDSWTDLLFYDRATGQGEFHTTDGQGNLTLLRQHTWRTTWDMIIPGFNFGSASFAADWTDLLFYDRAAGDGEFYTTDGQGNLTLLRQHTWRTTWDMIVPANFGGIGISWTDLLFYQR